MSKRKRHNEEQIHAILKETDAGLKPAELFRKYGMNQQTFYRVATAVRPSQMVRNSHSGWYKNRGHVTGHHRELGILR